MSAEITFYDGVDSVTGSNFLLKLGDLRIMIDCGLIQGEKNLTEANSAKFAYDPASLDILFVTHAHLDHVGRIPKFVKEGFVGKIYSTNETKLLARPILEDAMSILKKDQGEGMYEEEDIDQAMSMWQTLPYHKELDMNVPGKQAHFTVALKDAGHILGSSMYEFTYEGKKIVFTGDLGNSPSPLIRDTESIAGANFVVMESVYGDKNHEPKDERRQKLEKVIKDNTSRKGTLVIPAFSLERTQVIIYEINELVESKSIPAVPVFIDSPLAIKITEIYRDSTALFNAKAQADIASGDDIFDFKKLLYTVNQSQSEEIDHIPGPKIIIGGSGMSVGGRITHHEGNYLPDEKNTILLVGYQTLGSLGRKLYEGAKQVTIGGRNVKVKAKIETIFGYSSHKDSDHLLEFAESTADTVEKYFIAMGEPKSRTYLAQRIKDNLGKEAICPERGETYKLF